MPNANAADALVRCVIAWMSELLNRIVKGLLQPAPASTLIESVLDVSRSKADLIAENALLRHQLALLKRQSKRVFAANVVDKWIRQAPPDQQSRCLRLVIVAGTTGNAV